MTQRLHPVDVVVVGLGAAGGTAVWPLAAAGLKVVGIEAGPRVSFEDYPFDEIRNDIRDWMGRFKANKEVPTTRRISAEKATRPLGATGPMMNAVGGTSIHWMTQSWRFLPYNFKTRSETIARYGAGAIPAGSTLADWPFGYGELEPFYDKVEFRHGVSGQAGNVKGKINHKGNIFEGPRRRPYPNPPLRRSGWNELTARPREHRRAPLPRPHGHPLAGRTTGSRAAPTAASAGGPGAGPAPRPRPTSTTSHRPRRPGTCTSSPWPGCWRSTSTSTAARAASRT